MRVNARYVLIGSVAISLFGAGCGKPVQKTPAAPVKAPVQAPKPTTPSQNPPVIAFGSDQSANIAINNELTAILKAFRNAKAFRTKFYVPSSNGTITTDLDYVRPNRFHSIMRLSGKPNTEVIVVDDSVYMRAEGGAWFDLTGTDTAKSIGGSLRSSMNGDASLDKIGVDPGTVVTKTEDTARSCTKFTSLVRSQSGSPASLEICAVNGLPKYVDITTDTGTISFEYYDFDALFLIERPM